MATALTHEAWFDQNTEKCCSANRVWLKNVVAAWAQSLDKRELAKRRAGSRPPVLQTAISDETVDKLLEKVLIPSTLTNPKWAATPQAQGYLFQTQLEIIMRYLNLQARSRNPVGPDGGIDLEARTLEGRALLIQVKKYSSPVRKELVEEFYQSSLNTSFGLVLPELWFVAPELTEGARAYCKSVGMIAKERADLREMLAGALKNGLDPDALLRAEPGRGS